MKKFESDIKIISILDSAEALVSQLDPDGIFGDMKVSYFKISSRSGKWSSRFTFAKGEALNAYGSLSPERRFWIDKLSLVYVQDDTNIKIKPSFTLFEAFGDVSQHPECVKVFLSSLKPVSRTKVALLKPQDEIFFNLCIDAIFNEVDGGLRSDGYRDKFSEIVVNYSENEVDLSTSLFVKEGRIIVSCRMDRFGISKKKVRLQWNFGNGYSTFSDCIFRKEEKVCPSVRLAFDLAKNLKGMYSSQRSFVKGKGTPGL